MARRRRKHGRDINGIFVLDKPQGLSSNQALQQAKYLFFAAKAGHTGSLDPLATGVLPICFGEATKLSQFLLDSDKRYTSTITLGMATTTGDSEGESVSEADTSHLTQEMVEAALEAFRGDIEQIPSMYSAIKHKGEPLYKLARRGEVVEREARKVTIYSLDLLEFEPGAQARVTVDVHCSKGTYIRSIAQDLGDALAVGGHVSMLRRTQAGPFGLDQALTLDDLEQRRGEQLAEVLDPLILPSEMALGHLPEVRMPEASGFYIQQGQAVMVPQAPTSGLVRMLLDDGTFLGVGVILDDGRVGPRRLMVG